MASLLRLQLQMGEFVTRDIYYAKWKTSEKDCCLNSSKIVWHNVIDIIDDKVDSFWGLEVAQFAKLIYNLTTV